MTDLNRSASGEMVKGLYGPYYNRLMQKVYNKCAASCPVYYIVPEFK